MSTTRRYKINVLQKQKVEIENMADVVTDYAELQSVIDVLQKQKVEIRKFSRRSHRLRRAVAMPNHRLNTK